MFEFKKCFTNYKQLLRFVVLIICICVSAYQLAGCFLKIKFPPISTHYKFAHDTIKYPIVTICRNPPFKTHLFGKYGLAHSMIHIGSTWNSFKFDEYTLMEFFEETTYTKDEVLRVVALDKYSDNVNITTLFSLTFGRCFTITPNKESNNWGTQYGYKFRSYDTNETGTSSNPSGLRMYLQDTNDKFSEKGGKVMIFHEYLFVQIGFHVQVNLKISKYNQLSSTTKPCNSEDHYSQSACMEDGVNKQITEDVGCSTPWVPNKNLDECKTPNQTVKVVEFSTPGFFLNNYVNNQNCLLKCNITSYTPFLQSIHEEPSYASIKIYLSSQLYTLMEEIVGYDWNAFLADLGGSLGFLLGLSVLSMITIFEQMINTAIKIKNSKRKSVELNNQKNNVEIPKEQYKNEFDLKNINCGDSIASKY